MLLNPENHVSESMKSVFDLYEVEVLLAYFLSQIDQPCTPAQLTEIATGEGVVNYFVYTEAIERMLANGTLELVEEDSVEVYRLTEKGLAGAVEFKKLVPKSFRDKIYAAGLKLFAKLRNEKSVDFETRPCGNGYQIRCVCKEGELELMQLSLFVPDLDQANFVRSKILLNPSEFYARVIDYLVNNEEYVPEINDDMDDI